MSRRPSEAELLAFIEGDLAPGDAARVRQALAEDSSLLAWVEGAMQDRAGLARLSEADALIGGPGLVDDAMAAAEREALIGAGDAALPGERGRGWSLGGWRVGMAAAVLVAAGAGVALLPSLRGPAAQGPVGPVASGESSSEGEEGLAPASERLAEAGGPAAGGSEALASSATPNGVEGSPSVAPAGPMPPGMIQRPQAVVSDLESRGGGHAKPVGEAGTEKTEESAEGSPEAFDLERSVALALEGRAFIRVRFDPGVDPVERLASVENALWLGSLSEPTPEGIDVDRFARSGARVGELRLARDEASLRAAFQRLASEASLLEVLALERPISPMLDPEAQDEEFRAWWLEPTSEWRWRIRVPMVVEPSSER